MNSCRLLASTLEWSSLAALEKSTVCQKKTTLSKTRGARATSHTFLVPTGRETRLGLFSMGIDGFVFNVDIISFVLTQSYGLLQSFTCDFFGNTYDSLPPLQPCPLQSFGMLLHRLASSFSEGRSSCVTSPLHISEH